MSFTIGSLFDGSGGFPLAASMCGGTPVWASEIEPFPIAVTRSRFPNMKHIGSVTDVKGNEVEPVDVITFGSPCQDLSVAGKRAGLKHQDNGDEETTRSGLFMEAVRIIKEMREATNGVYPRFAVWENVPGAFSSNKGEDFRTVCEELIKIVEPGAIMPAVPKKGWSYADSYSGERWSLSYRTYDAQYWGVPQRRRRIYLVLDLGGGCAGKVSFERKGVRGYFAEGRIPWQGTETDAEGCVGAADRKASYITFEPGIAAREGGHIYEGVSGTIRANAGDNQMSVAYSEEIYCIDGDKIGKAERRGGSGLGIRDGDKMYTLTAKDAGTHAVAYVQEAHNDMLIAGVDCRHMNEYPDLYPTLNAKPNGGHSLNFSHAVRIRYIVRRLTPTECARLQGFADTWAVPDSREEFTDEEYRFWLIVRNTHAEINRKTVKDYTKGQMLTWYNKLHTDGSEYKLWGNGIALPTALYVMQGISDVLKGEVTNV